MTTYEPGRLYLIDLDGETHEARYYGINPPYFLTREGHMTHRDNAANVRLAVVLDPEDEEVQAFAKDYSGFWRPETPTEIIANKIAAQITPPEPPMEEPTEWNAPVTDDRGDWSRAEGEAPGDTLRWAPRDWTKADWSTWDQMRNPRPYES